jgi:hypothetical protein
MTKWIVLCSGFFFIKIELFMENKIAELKSMIEDNLYVYCSLWACKDT